MRTDPNDLIEISGVTVNFPVCSKTFKQLQVQEIVSLPDEKPDMEQVLRVSVTAHVSETNLIFTPKAVSYEGQILTGVKLAVEGKIEQSIEYVADEDSQSVHAAHFMVPFSTYVVLEKFHADDPDLQVCPFIEDVFVRQMGKRQLFKNVLLLLNVTSCSEIFCQEEKENEK